MGFDYHKLKEKSEESQNQWTSNSDLFMVLSLVFLLLFVVSSLRNGSSSVQKSIQYQELKKRNQDLEQQILAYETLKEDHLKKQASAKEAKMYENLMSRLTLLQDEAKEEKNELRKRALENEQKEGALNQYQQIIRNIINTNMLAKQRIVRRNKVIKKRDQAIAENEEEISKLQKDIESKTETINKNNVQIAKINNDRDKQVKKLQALSKKNKKNRKVYRAKIKKLQKISANKIKALKKINDEAVEKLRQEHESTIALEKAEFEKNLESQKLTLKEQKLRIAEFKKSAQVKEAELSQKIEELDSTVAKVSTKLSQAEQDKVKLAKSLQANNEKFQEELAQMQSKHKARMDAEKKAFSKNLAKQKMSAKAKAKKLAEFQKKMGQKEAELKSKLNDLSAKLADGEVKLSATQKAAKDAEGRFLASLGNLKSENSQLNADLAQAKKERDARRKIAQQMLKAFKKKGIKASVDNKTGDVTINFGNEYFDAGATFLKKGMKKSLHKFMPSYTESLFSDPNIAKNIENVEIIGFASPTFNGRFINPKSLDPNDQKALKYNLKLSQGRANSVFNYIVDQRKLKYKHQRKLVPLIKVSGRSFLSSDIKDAEKFDGMSAKEFCKKYDCNKSQRVIVKFSLKN